MTKSKVSIPFILGFIIIVIFLYSIAPPHSSDTIQDMAGNRALVHPGDKLVLSVPYAKGAAKFSLDYDGEKIVGTGPFYREEHTLKDGKTSFTFGFYTIRVQQDKKGLIVQWNWPVCIAR